jgi:hypothetical protein
MPELTDNGGSDHGMCEHERAEIFAIGIVILDISLMAINV